MPQNGWTPVEESTAGWTPVEEPPPGAGARYVSGLKSTTVDPLMAMFAPSEAGGARGFVENALGPGGRLLTHMFDKARDAIKAGQEGKPAEALASGLEAIPVVGQVAETLSTVGVPLAEGNVAGAAGAATGLAIPFSPKIARGTAAMGRAVVSPRGAAVLKGAGKVAGGVATVSAGQALGHPFLGYLLGKDIVRGGFRQIAEAFKRQAAVTGVEAAEASLLEDLAQSQAGKKFATLDPAQQATVRDLAKKIQGVATAETPRPSVAGPPKPPAGAPVSAPAAPPPPPFSGVPDVNRSTGWQRIPPLHPERDVIIDMEGPPQLTGSRGSLPPPPPPVEIIGPRQLTGPRAAGFEMLREPPYRAGARTTVYEMGAPAGVPEAKRVFTMGTEPPPPPFSGNPAEPTPAVPRGTSTPSPAIPPESTPAPAAAPPARPVAPPPSPVAEPPAAAPRQPVARPAEPWQQDLDTFLEESLNDLRDTQAAKNYSGLGKLRDYEAGQTGRLEKEWYDAVDQAYSEGKPVPLKNRPEWAITAEQSAQRSGDTLDKHIRDANRKAVEEAVSAGKPVPVEVLAQYPDLTRKAAPRQPEPQPALPEAKPPVEAPPPDLEAQLRESIARVAKKPPPGTGQATPVAVQPAPAPPVAEPPPKAPPPVVTERIKGPTSYNEYAAMSPEELEAYLKQSPEMTPAAIAPPEVRAAPPARTRPAALDAAFDQAAMQADMAANAVKTKAISASMESGARILKAEDYSNLLKGRGISAVQAAKLPANSPFWKTAAEELRNSMVNSGELTLEQAERMAFKPPSARTVGQIVKMLDRPK
jgi:hypothetical protein